MFLERYRNRDHRNAANECCRGGGGILGCNNRACNNLFVFCAGPSGQAVADSGLCPYGVFNFTNYDDDFSFQLSMPSSSIVPGSQVSNPMVFQKPNERWRVSFDAYGSQAISDFTIHYVRKFIYIPAGTIPTSYLSL